VKPLAQLEPQRPKELPRAPEEAIWSRPRQRGSGMRTAGWAIGAAGVAAVAGGALFGLQAKSASDQITQAAQSGQPFDPAVEDRGKRAQTLQYVCYGAGGAALLGGALLLLLAPDDSVHAASGPSPRPVMTPVVAPVLTPGGAMATLGLRY
jgi:hypothetical protein